ncbi:non-hydrolyzing UDP-N-acetylglucosamine 2-epimerase [Rickettsiella endosymbiont of Aleochara curtula]|uniref:non-hydrolyzing UDP-N-acetylglucosamine 2-epimerase n=1 Tax=Rickettsiella endosymbiont of Aleochara curtula TaxID=3077936 RepID=UPI00313E8654
MKILSIFGTRPEAIKMAPTVKALATEFGSNSMTCVTAQHRGMLDQVLDLFQIKPNYDLNLMKISQNLTDITVNVLNKLRIVLRDCMPDKVIVHGDTSTTFAASLAAFYEKIPVVHVEAGLRSGDMYSPWPEEINRKLTTAIADIHFAPTENAKMNLLREGIEHKKIIVTGNTVIDALIYVVRRIENERELRASLHAKFFYLNNQKKLILITGHRRENNIKKFKSICEAIALLGARDDVEVIYPVHPNPAVNHYVRETLGNKKNMFLIEPQDYLSFVFLMKKSYLILTDSGGIQEEAPSLGKPVLVMRDNTERHEALLTGTIKLVGTCQKRIYAEAIKLLEDETYYNKTSFLQNPFGDGKASQRIVNSLKNIIKDQYDFSAMINLDANSQRAIYSIT